MVVVVVVVHVSVCVTYVEGKGAQCIDNVRKYTQPVGAGYLQCAM